jgi:hypothetical protein
MTWHELFTALERADPASEVVVVLYRLRGAPEVFALEEAQDTGEYVPHSIAFRGNVLSPSVVLHR